MPAVAVTCSPSSALSATADAPAGGLGGGSSGTGSELASATSLALAAASARPCSCANVRLFRERVVLASRCKCAVLDEQQWLRAWLGGLTVTRLRNELSVSCLTCPHEILLALLE